MEQYVDEELYEEEYEEERSWFSKIWKRLKYILIIALIIIVVFSIIQRLWKLTIEDTTSSENIFSQEYVIHNNLTTNEKLYWLVVSDNIINLMSSIWWTISYENCQPWKKVFKWEIIYKIDPSQDTATQNSEIQLKYIKQQMDNLNDIISNTQKSFDVQKELLVQQEETNQRNYLLFLENLENLEDQKDLSLDDMELSQDNLDTQLDALKQSQNMDLSKLDSSVDNFKQQLKITISDSMRKLDDTFGITDPNSNASYEASLSANNPSLKGQVKTDFNILNNKLSSLSSMSNDELSKYISDLSSLFSIAAQSVDASIPSTELPQSSQAWASIETFYTMFSSYSTALLTYKTNFESLSSAFIATRDNYDTQISTLETNINSMDDNKIPSTELTFDTNINSLKSQLNNLDLSTQNITKQIQNFDNTQNISLWQLKSQYLSLAANYEVLSNTLWWEIIRSPIDWIIKNKQASQLNKTNPSSPLCQIIPSISTSIKVQIFSPYKLEIWQKIVFLDWANEIWESQIEYELPYVDSTTQNYTYEVTSTNINLLEGKRISIWLRLDSTSTGNILIPLDYVQPKLDWYYVYIKVSNAQWQTAAFNKKIQVWDIDNGYIQVLSWLQIWNILMK